MAASVEQFFQSYAHVLNRSVGERDGLDAVRAHLADSFVVATPDGVRCGQDDEITETLRQMLDLWRAIGVKEIAIRVVAGRAAVAGVHRHPDTVLLVPGSQRQHRGRLPGARTACPLRDGSGALLHERRAGRVLYAHALVAAPRLALGRFAALARVLGDPRLGMAGAFLSLRRVVPNRYPLARDVEWYIADEQRLGRLLDYGVIVPRLQRLYEWSAEEIDNHACSSWYGTGTRSTHGPSRSDTSGALRTCRSRLGSLNASHGLAEGATATGDVGRISARRWEPCAGAGLLTELRGSW